MLGTSRRGRVLASLREVLYVGFDDGDVLPVETPRAAGLPTALRLGVDVDGWGVVAGDHVAVGDGVVRLPAQEVAVVREWRPARVRRAPAAGAGQDPLTALVSVAATRLGLGPGLTPSADDELCGLLLVARAAGLAVDLDACLPRTTDLSASLVRAARRGYAVAPLVRLVDAGLCGRAGSAADRDAVLALGHSSGPALLAGVARGLGALRGEGRSVA